MNFKLLIYLNIIIGQALRDCQALRHRPETGATVSTRQVDIIQEATWLGGLLSDIHRHFSLWTP